MAAEGSFGGVGGVGLIGHCVCGDWVRVLIVVSGDSTGGIMCFSMAGYI